MYYRRKILLSLLEVFDDQLEKLRLQKLLFLYTRMQEKPSFNFLPYKFGCFSFQANADLHTMIKYEQVKKEGKSWIKDTDKSYLASLKENDRLALHQLKKQYKKASVTDLLQITYRNHPFYALNSTILDDVLNKEEQKQVLAYKNRNDAPCLFTIGYEGISLETYINKLIANNIKILVDVRKNAMSMKYGFNKSQLQKACRGVGIKYTHISDVGIPSFKRKQLDTQADYDQLFQEYRQTMLPETKEAQKEIVELFQSHKRVALTCFEAKSCQCHRRPLAEYMMQTHNLETELIHL